jgi:hypothetical protein
MTLKERIDAATSTEHGFSSDEIREAHIRAIVRLVQAVKK